MSGKTRKPKRLQERIYALLPDRALRLFRNPFVSRLSKKGNGSKPKRSKHIRSDNSDMEAEHRRRDTRASVDSQVGHLWDASENPPRMERLLQKLTPRTRKDEEVQRAKEERFERNVVITEWIKRNGYNLFVAWLQQIEGDAYYRLRNMGQKPANETSDFYIGKQNGKLELIEDIRLMFSTARMELRQAIEEKQKEKEAKQSE